MPNETPEMMDLASRAERNLNALKAMSTPDKLEEVLVALRRVIRATDLHSKQLVKTASVTSPQLLLLQVVHNKGDITISELARDMSLSQATVTSILDRLQKRELVQRVRCEQDKRKVYPRLTEHGRRILASAPTALQNDFMERFRLLDEWEQSMIIAALQKVGEMMNANNIDAAPFLDIGALDRAVPQS